jgi:hypothetical protein
VQQDPSRECPKGTFAQALILDKVLCCACVSVRDCTVTISDRQVIQRHLPAGSLVVTLVSLGHSSVLFYLPVSFICLRLLPLGHLEGKAVQGGSSS